MRRAATQTATSAKAANNTLLIRTMTIGAESKAGSETNACQAYAKRAPAASARICLSPQPGRRDHSVTMTPTAMGSTLTFLVIEASDLQRLKVL
jgi:hypothetical protein